MKESKEKSKFVTMANPAEERCIVLGQWMLQVERDAASSQARRSPDVTEARGGLKRI